MRKPIVAAIAVLLALGASGIRPADALLRDSITINPEDKIERDYPPLTGQNPTNNAQDSATCESALYCDTIPLDVKVPASLGANANYVIQITMTWETTKANGTTVNDVDLFLEDSTRSVLTKSATQNEPEVLTAPKLKQDRYYITVVNYLGDNPGYHLMVRFLTDASNTSELLDNQGPEASGPEATPEPSAPPIDHSNDPTTFIDTPPPSIATFEAGTDSAFDPSLFAAEPGTPTGPGFDPTQLAGSQNARATVDPASGVAVFFALVVLPLALVGGTGAFIWRRRAAGFAGI